MNEPKRRGRRTNAEIAAQAALAESMRLDPPKGCPECGQVEGHYDDCPVGMGATVAAFNALDGIVSPTRTPLMDGASVFTQRQAQAYANRVWAGQSPDVKHAERIARVQRALAGQNLPFEGVVLP